MKYIITVIDNQEIECFDTEEAAIDHVNYLIDVCDESRETIRVFKGEELSIDINVSFGG